MKLARTAAGLSQAKLADAVGHKHKSDIGAWEAGDRFPAEDVLARIDKELGQEGHLLTIAGYTLDESTVAEEIQSVIDHHMVQMMADIQKILGRR